MSDGDTYTGPTVYKQPVRMDPTDKARWIRALRSGAFKQTKGLLFDRDTYGFCCLGVLRTLTDCERDADSELLSASACGIASDVQGHLAGANDGEPLNVIANNGYEPVSHYDGPESTFDEIAEWVEKWL